jgi:hypothetical protein
MIRQQMDILYGLLALGLHLDPRPKIRHIDSDQDHSALQSQLGARSPNLDLCHIENRVQR